MLKKVNPCFVIETGVAVCEVESAKADKGYKVESNSFQPP